MTGRMHVVAEPLTETEFAPFGRIVSAPESSPDYSRPLLDLWRLPFAADGPAQLQIMRYHRQEMVLTQFERHLAVTETRVSLGNAGIIVVAGTTNRADPGAAPEPMAVRAFRIDAGRGVMLHRGVWHGLDCFPIDADHADFLFLSDAATEQEIESWQAPTSGRLTHVIDFKSFYGPTFEVVA